MAASGGGGPRWFPRAPTHRTWIQRYGFHLYILITIAEAFAAGLYIGANL